MVDRNGSILLRGIGEPADESVFGARNRHCILCNLISMRPEETHSTVCPRPISTTRKQISNIAQCKCKLYQTILGLCAS